MGSQLADLLLALLVNRYIMLVSCVKRSVHRMPLTRGWLLALCRGLAGSELSWGYGCSGWRLSKQR